MSYKARICLVLAALLLASATMALGSEDPELRQCKKRCQAQHQSDEKQLRQCVATCEEHHRHSANDRSPIEKLRECNKDCEHRQQQERLRADCQRRCQERYEKEVERFEERGKHGYDREREEYHGRGAGQRQSSNPYVFEDRHFFTGMQTQHGRLRILHQFTERSELLRGIENFRVAILEAQPQTFIVPKHLDADTIVFVARGRGAVSTVRQDRRESFNIKEGDIFRINAGTTTYFVNRDNNDRLILVKLIQPVNTPGHFQEFFGAGGENPESYFKAFSNEILEAAFNVDGERVRRLFGQQKQGAIIKASPEQIRSMSQHQEGGIWPFGSESKGTHNIYDNRPIYDNQFGQYYEVDASQFRQLRDLDLAISFSNMSEGAMTAPFYNSKATKIAVVVEGEGYFEMACPHLSESESRRTPYDGEDNHHLPRDEAFSRQSRGQASYQTVRSRLKAGTVVIVPAGHPFVAVASNNQNLQIVSFKVNAYNNQQYTLAGKRNVMNQLEREAKELAFGVPAREVEEVFRSQKEEFFFEGPGRRADA
ncbi:vicilin Cor a 11.0101 [Salvia miltiorrhiza]|uniref:vicilin Cor a 11.0101 n=1 Tax=Salvia miltiorrhiza TaxID=226208 RepID=UPI0025AC6A21|nr:vicilin Cor a 11.0101 [Salvia miltiorrhiza]